MLAAFLLAATSLQQAPADVLAWRELAPLPAPGRRAAGLGVVSGRLVLAGGVSEAGGRPLADLLLLEPGAGGEEDAWVPAGTLPGPRSHTAGCPHPDGGWILAGGEDGLRALAGVLWLRRVAGGRVELAALPPLPAPRTRAAAALAGGRVVVAGGAPAPGGPPCPEIFLLDPAAPAPGWRELPPCPGPARLAATAGGRDGAFFLFGGLALVPASPGGWIRRPLQDAWRLDPETGGWSRLADLPRPLVAAPGPALAVGGSHLLLAGGLEGGTAGALGGSGSPRDEVLAYDTITDTWCLAGRIPGGAALTAAAPWQGEYVLAGGVTGEAAASRRVLAGRPTGHPTPFRPADQTVLVLYLLLIVGVGAACARANRNTDDFFRAGRRMPWWATGLSIFGTQLSAITFMAIPAKVYATDWTYLPAQLCIVAVAPLVVTLFLPRYRALDVTTAYEYLEARFGRGARLFGSISFLAFQLGRMGVVLFLPALALASVTGADVLLCIAVMGLLATLYTVLGGIEAVIWTDVLQVVVLLGAALAALAVVLAALPEGGGTVLAEGLARGKFRVLDLDLSATRATAWVVLLGNFTSYLTVYATDQTMVQRYMTTPDRRQAARSIWVNAGLSVVASLIFYFLGTALWAWFRHAPERLDPTLATDAVLPWFVATAMPPGLAGLVVAGLFAAAMSSLDSSMNSVAAVVVTDLRTCLPGRAGARGLGLARAVTVAAGLVATVTALGMAAAGARSMVDVFMAILGLLGAGVGGIFLLGVLTRRVDQTAALAGAAAGIAAVLWARQATGLHFFLYSAVGTGTCLLTGYGVALVRGSLSSPPR